MTAVVMFGFQFLVSQKFAKHTGSGARAALIFQIGSNVCGLIVISAVSMIRNGGVTFGGVSLFTLLMATLSACNSIAYTICSLKSLGRINLSLYSVFSMLGGMVLPFILGVCFFDEGMSFGKLLSAALITAAIAVTIKPGEGKTGVGYYIGVFVLNGMSGVISKLYQSAPFEKADEYGYMLLCAAVSAVISAAALLFVKGEYKKPDRAAAGAMGICGTLSYAGNLILLIALAHVPASAQYPLVTGGVMAVSTLLCFFTDKKPTHRELISVALSVCGILAMILI